MVAGFLGARDNAIGRVGVAPGAILWDVRVADATGFITNRDLLCGIDWITHTRLDRNRRNDIAVANLSLGDFGADDGDCGFTNGDPIHVAICASTAAGVTYVVSAGNESVDVAGIIPASYDEVLTVTAMADFDGQPGGTGSPDQVCTDTGQGSPDFQDDTRAFFSNFASLAEDAAHTVAAPGVCTTNTFPGGQYAFGSGTSFSAPRAAGTVALCIAFGECAGLSPTQIVTKIVADAEAYNLADPSYGFTGDPAHPVADGYYGWLIHAAEY